MATYEYRCHNCKAFLSVTRPVGKALPYEPCLCGGKMQRVYSPPAVKFKGSGFYRTDNA